MKFKLCALFSAVTFAVTACGGSGGDDNITVNQPTKSVENNEQPFEMKEQIIMWKGAQHAVGSRPNFTGRELIINNSPTMLAGQDSNDKTALTKITVNGVDLLFEPPYSSSHSYTVSNDSKWKMVVNQYEGMDVHYGADTAYARYGMFNLPVWVYGGDYESNMSEDYALFYQGNPTSLDDMKKLEKQADNVTYKGQAFSIREGKYGVSNLSPFAYGTSQFTVNFKDKTLKGDVNQWYDSENKVADIKPVNIDAKIRANTFAGTANKTGTVEGKFYGPNAANLAGSFNDKSQKLRGVFGAVKK
ncbi:MAG: transferrin-binding protein-like solute binding protein [Neisseriaceae bacterium]|nr:transferrin-binding protein-like solute binding protein [Neisseriaceae bacterium]